MIPIDQSAYGLRDGSLMFIADVARGLACNCVCVGCKRRLVAKKGPLRSAHFAHEVSTTCRGAPETVLHRLAKELLASLQELHIPPYEFSRVKKARKGIPVSHKEIIVRGGSVPVDRVRIEKSEGDFIPDVVVESGQKSLIVEIAVTNDVSRLKLRKLRNRGLPAIELKLRASDALLSRELLRNKISGDLACKAWLFHPSQRVAEKNFLLKYRNAIARGRGMRVKDEVRSLVSTKTPAPEYLFSSATMAECDRVVEGFFDRHGRYPTAEECIKYWPRLWAK